MIDNLAAIQSLRPGAELFWQDGTVVWLDKKQTQPTEEEIQAEIARLEAEQIATAYQRNRQPEYPPITDLADALYWSNQGDNSKLDAYYAACAAVKAKYPKPDA